MLFQLYLSHLETDSVSVDKNVAKKCNVYYESTCTPGAAAKQKKVYCYISPKQIQVKEFILLGLIPKRIYSCKVCPSTRVSYTDQLVLISSAIITHCHSFR